MKVRPHLRLYAGQKFLRQLKELDQLTLFGYRATLTWKNLQTQVALTKAQVQHTDDVRRLAKLDLCPQTLTAMCNLIATIQNDERKARIKSWKQRMQTSKHDLHKWLKKGQEVSSGAVLNSHGEASANKAEIFAAITAAWDKVFNKFADGLPPVQPDAFGPTMKSAPCQLLPLTAKSFWRLGASLLEEACETLVLETWRFTCGGRLVRNARFGDLALHFWRKSRTKRSFWRLGASLLEEAV